MLSGSHNRTQMTIAFTAPEMNVMPQYMHGGNSRHMDDSAIIVLGKLVSKGGELSSESTFCVNLAIEIFIDNRSYEKHSFYNWIIFHKISMA